MKKIIFIIVLSIVVTESAAATLCELPTTERNYAKSFPGLSAGQDDWLFRDHDLIEDFGPRRVGYEGLSQMIRKLDARGIKLVMVPTPTRGLVHAEKLGPIAFDRVAASHSYKAYLQNLRKLGALVPDLEQLLEEEHESPLFFARDHHWTPDGARKVAELTGQVLKNNQFIEPSELQIETAEVNQTEIRGSYTRAAKALCDVAYAAEPFSVFETSISYDLFAEPSDGELVLVGTSNSQGSHHFNFGGFLSQEIGHEVVNLAKSGGGYNEALEAYLSSEQFQKSPPRFLIWEVPGYYRLNTKRFYETVLDLLETTVLNPLDTTVLETENE